MNIFLSSDDPLLCAQALDDKRVVKMALETAQLLASATFSLGFDIGYAPTHINHPCAKWARSGRFAFLWLIEHGMYLCNEYEHRFGDVHASKEVILKAYQYRHLFSVKTPEFSFNCSGFDTGDVFFDYKLCLVHKWHHLDGFVSARSKKPKWTRRNRPNFASQLWHTDFKTV